MKPTFFDFDLFPIPERAQPKNTMLGAGEKDIWIWYEADETEQREMESFLAKVFGAAQINLAQSTKYICLTKEESISFSQVEGAGKAQFVFLFGVDGKRLGLHFSLLPYQPVVFNGATYVFIDAISDIFEERKAGKKEKSGQLWRTLKHCFGIE